MGGLRRALVAVAAGLALADASIVALALPPILAEMHTTISGVAAVIGVYALVLAVAIWPASRVRVGPWGFVLFAIGSLGCGLAGSLELLLVFRAIQAVGGAAALIAAFTLLDAGESPVGHRLWLGAALVGTAAGPAIGGALTEAFDWRAIFIVQAPI
ncbi:MAG TPA: MFS transporter, partial [Solirubrobacter sp.]